jgi:hypothetical protein
MAGCRVDEASRFASRNKAGRFAYISVFAADILSFVVAAPPRYAIAVEAYSLPDPFHRDPANRVLVATHGRIKQPY